MNGYGFDGEDMKGAPADWYPNPSGEGTRYWDGLRWTSETRPKRRPFAAAASHKWWGIGSLLMGISGVGAAFTPAEGTENSFGDVLRMLAFATAFLLLAAYLLRGQGPTTKAVEARVAAARPVDLSVRGAQLVPPAPVPSARPAVDPARMAAAQREMLANPDTTKALENLQRLLYTQAITEEEYERLKARLLGSN